MLVRAKEAAWVRLHRRSDGMYQCGFVHKGDEFEWLEDGKLPSYVEPAEEEPVLATSTASAAATPPRADQPQPRRRYQHQAGAPSPEASARPS